MLKLVEAFQHWGLLGSVFTSDLIVDNHQESGLHYAPTGQAAVTLHSKDRLPQMPALHESALQAGPEARAIPGARAGKGSGLRFQKSSCWPFRRLKPLHRMLQVSDLQAKLAALTSGKEMAFGRES